MIIGNLFPWFSETGLVLIPSPPEPETDNFLKLIELYLTKHQSNTVYFLKLIYHVSVAISLTLFLRTKDNDFLWRCLLMLIPKVKNRHGRYWIKVYVYGSWVTGWIEVNVIWFVTCLPDNRSIMYHIPAMISCNSW